MTKQDFIDRAYLALAARDDYDVYHDHAAMWEMAEWMYQNRPKTAKVKKEASTRARFVKPTPQEVDEYIKEMGYRGFTGDTFVTFYDSKGWKIGNSGMKDWKASVRTWWTKYKEKNPQVSGEKKQPVRRRL